MKNWTQLIRGMRLKQGIWGLVALFELLLFGYAWQKESVLFLLVIHLLIAAVVGGIVLAWRIYRYGLPQSVTQIKPKILKFFQKLRDINWQIHFHKKAKTSNLPWFLVVGPTGSGKTSLLNASGCHYKVLAGDKLDGCHSYDKFFANEAVMIDTKGEVLLDEARWKVFLLHLKKTKVHHLLKGVLLALSAESFLHENQDNMIHTIKQRIDELYRLLGVRLPIYCVLTQGDKLDGFDVLRMNLDEKARQQIFGQLFSHNAFSLTQCKLGFQNLEERIAARCFNQLSMLATYEEKAQVLHLVYALRLLHHRLEQFFQQLMQDTIYQESLLLSGIFLTGSVAHQEDCIGYFTEQLFSEHLFKSKKMPSVSLYRQKKLSRYKYVQLFALGLGTFAAIGFLTSAYFKSARLLHHGKMLAESNAAASKNLSKSQAKSELYAIGRHVDALRHYKDLNPWYQRLGMTRVNSQLDIYESMLAKSLKQTFYQPIKALLEKELKNTHKQWRMASEKEKKSMRGKYYTHLKLYLMLNFPHQIDLDFAASMMARLWLKYNQVQLDHQDVNYKTSYALSRTFLESLSQSSAERLEQVLSPHSLLISEVRRDLQTASGVSNVFSGIEYQFEEQLGRLGAEELVDDMGVTLWKSSYRIPRLYTRDEYEQTIKKVFQQHALYSAKKDWVIYAPLKKLKTKKPDEIKIPNDKKQMQQMLQDLYALYFTKYILAWERLIGSTTVLPFSAYDDASQQLRVLYQGNGAFKALFNALNQNFSLKKKLSATEWQAIPEFIQSQLIELESITNTTSGQNLLLQNFQKQLEILQQDLERLSFGEAIDQSAQRYVAQLLNGKGQETELYKASLVVEQLSNSIQNSASRRAFKKLLLSPVAETYRVIMQEATRGLEQDWQNNVLKPYQERLSNHFPFNRHGPDANLADFSAFFRPQSGTFARFFKTLSPFIQKTGDNFRPKSWLGVAFPISNRFLNNLSEVGRLSAALFSNGQADLTLRYAIYPIPTPGVKEILFSSNGQSYPYRNGPQEWVSFLWPGQDAMDNEAFIRITQTFSDAQATHEFQGAWGLFHLLASASHTVKTARGYRLQWIFKQGGNVKTIRVLFASKAQTDPFEKLIFHPLKLAESMQAVEEKA